MNQPTVSAQAVSRKGTVAGVARVRALVAENPTLVLLVVLAILVLVTGIVEPNYLSAGGLRSTLLQAAPLGILAGAQTILLLSGGIDLSLTMIATASAYVAATQSPQGAAVAISLGLLVGLILGSANGVGVAVFRVNPLIMTLATSGIILGLFTAWSQTILQGSTRVAEFIRLAGGGSFFGNRIPYSVLVWAAIAAFLLWLLRRSGWGRLIYAIGDNEVAVRLAGVRVWQVRIATYALAGLLGAIGGMLLGGRNGSVDMQLGNAFLLPSIAAAVIGGTSIFGGVGGY
ncbi:MAG TPA: ABC transporter permease, partial [Caldilineaceae bacterium]|nr:ABC transporter permease [Caldilineaceae bacterium]